MAFSLRWQSLQTRLAELEKVQERERRARAYSARVADAPKFHEWVRWFLKALGTEQGAKESLAEGMVGITMSELKLGFRRPQQGVRSGRQMTWIHQTAGGSV
jgi:hypothetical protein